MAQKEDIMYMVLNRLKGKYAIFLCEKCSDEKNRDIFLVVTSVVKDSLGCYLHTLECPICKSVINFVHTKKLENLGIKKIKQKKQKV